MGYIVFYDFVVLFLESKMKKQILKKDLVNKVSKKKEFIEVTQKSSVRWSDLDKAEQMSVVCRLFCDGLKLSQIAKKISQDYRTDFKRESTYPIIADAVKKEWIRYIPPPASMLEIKLKEMYDWLKIQVIHTSQSKDVAYHGAKMLIEMLKDFKQQNRKEVHLGFAGGHAMRKLTQLFASMLSQSNGTIPKKLVLHAIVAGFDVYEPTTDPNTFFTLFQTANPAGIEFSFVGLHTPPVVFGSQYKKLRMAEGIKESYDEAKKIDIIITSATNWSDKDSTFRKYMEKSKDCFDLLESSNCIGDMLWQPIGPREPIDLKTKIRAMTLWELSQIPDLIKKGKRVVLFLAACSKCGQPKSEVLRAILNQKNRLITHLVADSRSVRGILH